MLGNALCDALNGIRQNTNTVHLETDNLFWLTQSNLVWADIVGDDKAQEYLLQNLVTWPIKRIYMIRTKI